VRPGNSWDLRACTQKPGESLRDFIRHFSKRYTKLPSVTQSKIVHAFLEGTTCRDLVRELRRRRRWGPSSMARKASVWMTRPQKASNPRSPSRNTSGARIDAARHARRGATATGTKPSQLTRPERALEQPLEAPTCSTTC
jgi:hypothetical protein